MILDIELARLSGIDVGKFLREENRNFHTQIIYVSSKETYAMKLFSVQPLDFLVKPVKKEELFKLRFQLATGQLQNTAAVRACKKDIARIKTVLSQRELTKN